MNRKSGNPLPSVPRWIKKKERKEQVGGQQPSGQWDKKKKKSFSAKVIKQGPNGQTGYKRQISLDVNSFCLETPAAFAQSKETQSYSAGLRVHQRSKRKEGKHAVVVLFHTVSFFINIRLPSLSLFIYTQRSSSSSIKVCNGNTRRGGNTDISVGWRFFSAQCSSSSEQYCMRRI